MVRSIDWRKLGKREGVIEKKTHFETGDGKLITWGSRDSREAQIHLRNRARGRQ